MVERLGIVNIVVMDIATDQLDDVSKLGEIVVSNLYRSSASNVDSIVFSSAVNAFSDDSGYGAMKNRDIGISSAQVDAPPVCAGNLTIFDSYVVRINI